jgi:hypothetical protein
VETLSQECLDKQLLATGSSWHRPNTVRVLIVAAEGDEDYNNAEYGDSRHESLACAVAARGIFDLQWSWRGCLDTTVGDSAKVTVSSGELSSPSEEGSARSDS